MSYIFSSNGNNYTFKKLDSMLINLPQEDGQHILMRETIDNVPQYSWTTAKIIIKLNSAENYTYIPSVTTHVTDEVNLKHTLKTTGTFLLTTKFTCYVDDLDVFNDCNDINEVIDKDFQIKVNINGIPVLSTIIIDTLNPILTVTNSTVIDIENNDIDISIKSNMPICLLKNIEAINMTFESLTNG